MCWTEQAHSVSKHVRGPGGGKRVSLVSVVAASWAARCFEVEERIQLVSAFRKRVLLTRIEILAPGKKYQETVA